MSKRKSTRSGRIGAYVMSILNDSRSVGIILIICTLLSLLFSNLSFSQEGYLSLWEKSTSFGGRIHLPENILLWINDGLMAIFFFLVGMEIKREIKTGELASVKKSMLPIIAAIGGMLVPALIYFLFNGNTPYHHGWGIPMATDIAFSLGILSLLGKKSPVQLKVFLAALAIIDDLGAILVIAIFYASSLNFTFLALGLAGAAVTALFNMFKVKQTYLYLLVGVFMWYCLLNSGVHATIAGVLLAFCIPTFKIPSLEKTLDHFVNFIVIPLFALANTAIIFPEHMGHIYEHPISLGIFFGLVLGKPIGIVLFSYLSTKLKIAALPSNTHWNQMIGIGCIAGIGFTMSIFVSTLAFDETAIQDIAKISVLIASTIAGILGYVYLNRRFKHDMMEHKI